jgi:spore coat protein U-like protein
MSVTMRMPMTRILLAACCALLSAWALAAAPVGRGPGSRAGGSCPAFPAQCQVNAPVFNFGRHPMTPTSPPVLTQGTISVTCTRHPQDRLEVQVHFQLKGLPPQPHRQMRDAIGGAYLGYDLFVDPARTRMWGDGHGGTGIFEGACFLDERNRVCTVPFLLYGTVYGQQELTPPGPYLGAVISRVEYQFLDCRP